jgi:hypothetical protein
MWRRRGVVTLRGIENIGLGRMNELFEREKARRFFASAADIDAELKKYRDLSDAALEELVKLVSGSAYEREAAVRRIDKAAATLAEGVTEPATVECARLVAILKLECSYADSLYFRMVREGALGSRPSREVLMWKEKVGRRLESLIRTLAYMKHLEYSDVRASVSRLKLVAG